MIILPFISDTKTSKLGHTTQQGSYQSNEVVIGDNNNTKYTIPDELCHGISSLRVSNASEFENSNDRTGLEQPERFEYGSKVDGGTHNYVIQPPKGSTVSYLLEDVNQRVKQPKIRQNWPIEGANLPNKEGGGDQDFESLITTRIQQVLNQK